MQKKKNCHGKSLILQSYFVKIHSYSIISVIWSILIAIKNFIYFVEKENKNVFRKRNTETKFVKTCGKLVKIQKKADQCPSKCFTTFYNSESIFGKGQFSH